MNSDYVEKHVDQPFCRKLVEKFFPGTSLKSYERLNGGVSADVFKLMLAREDGQEIGIVLRIHGATHSGHDAALEFELLQALYKQDLAVPEPLFLDLSFSLIKLPFILMRFIDGVTLIPAESADAYIRKMAFSLAKIHAFDVTSLPLLPARLDTIPEVFDFFPESPSLEPIKTHLSSMKDTAYTGKPRLVHGDFWPENLLWQGQGIVAILDWEDAALGDPLSDVATSRLELRYKFGPSVMQVFTKAYEEKYEVDMQRLALWQIYVAAATYRYMGEWRLAPQLEAKMRIEALASIKEAGDALLTGASFI